MPKYYIAHAGLRGYLPSYTTVGTSKTAVAEDMASTHDLSTYQKRKLVAEQWLDLDLAQFGNEYIEIDEIDEQTYNEWANE